MPAPPSAGWGLMVLSGNGLGSYWPGEIMQFPPLDEDSVSCRMALQSGHPRAGWH